MKHLKILSLALALVSGVALGQVSQDGGGRVINNGVNNLGTIGGTNTYTVTPSPSPAGYVQNVTYCGYFTNANTGAATLNINSLGAISIVKQASTALASGDIASTSSHCLLYNGTNFEIDHIDNASAGGSAYSTIDSNGSAVTQRATVNYISGTNATVTCVDNAGSTRTDCTVSATAGSSAPVFPANAQTATYTLLASDFSNFKTIAVASGTFTITAVASGSQPASGQGVWIINYGSGVVTFARSGQNINGGATSIAIPAGSQQNPTGLFVVSDGTNYLAQPFGFVSGTVTTTGSPASGQMAAFSGSASVTTATGHNMMAPWSCSDSSGSGAAQVCNTSPTFTPVSGDQIVYVTTTSNTGDVTVNVNSLGAKHIRKWSGSSTLAAGDLVLNTPVLMTYDGTNWEITTIGNAPSGSSPSFSAVTSGTNTTAAMLVGTGASLGPTGSGTLNANQINGASVPTSVPVQTNGLGQLVTLVGSRAWWCTSPGLGDGLNAMAAGTYLQTNCYNMTGATVTLTSIKCYSDNAGTSTCAATNGAGTSLLTGAITATASYAAGTQSGTTTIASGDFVKITFVADGTSKQMSMVFGGTY